MTRLISKFVCFSVIALLMAITGDALADEIRINHDGFMHSSLRNGTTRGIGVSRIKTRDFTLSVRGQFRMLSSAKLSLRGRDLAHGRATATPVWISLAAIGEIQLEIPGEAGAPPSIHHAKTAVYKVSENRWILDAVEME